MSQLIDNTNTIISTDTALTNNTAATLSTEIDFRKCIGGMVQATGSDVTLTTAVAGGVGFTAIIVAWLAQLNPPVILLVTFLFSVLEKGSSVVQSSFGLSSDCADVLQGIILFFILGCELFIRYQFVFRGKGGTRA